MPISFHLLSADTKIFIGNISVNYIKIHVILFPFPNINFYLDEP